MKKQLTLENIKVSFDPETANIILHTEDSKLKGKPFKLTVSHNTDTYKTLLKALEEENLVDLSQIDIPSSIRIENLDQLTIPGADPRFNFNIGQTFQNEPVTLNLQVSPHTLISGSTGSGKSVAIRDIYGHALNNTNINIWGIDLKRVELGSYRQRDQDVVVHAKDNAYDLLNNLVKEIEERYEILEQKELNNVSDTDLPAIYLIIDEIGPLLGKSNENSPEGRLQDAKTEIIKANLEIVLQTGRAAGVFAVIGTQIADPKIITGTMKASLSNRILMGLASSKEAINVLGERNKYGGALLKTRGRGILIVNNKQTLFQTYFLPYEQIKK